MAGIPGGQTFVSPRNEDNAGVIGCEWFNVIDRRERAAQGVVFDQTSGNQLIRRAKDVRQRASNWQSAIFCRPQRRSLFS